MASPGLVYAKRKKTPFRGPMLHINPRVSSNSPSGRSRDTSLRRSASVPRRRSGEIIEEEDEDEVEEVDGFSPVLATDAEETIFKGGAEPDGKKGWVEHLGVQ
jgi:hypothetical protein